ncbi:MAG: UDP-N-acetylmuramate dehydrogenase [Patescibacteria group bacterium]|nr:UDP-N-acetylmuramate dehydrogenase [Patescibacteria group bacterium]
MKIINNKSLKDLTTFKIGGEAEFFTEIYLKEELIEALAWAKSKNLPVFILGGGSNLLISEQGLRGLTIKMINNEIELKGNNIIAGAGLALADLIGFAFKNNLTGLEWGTGIPGSVGGAVRGNAGAYGGEISRLVEEVEAYDILKNKWLTISKNDCLFSYRESHFKKDKNLIIWQVKFTLAKDEHENIKTKLHDIVNQRMPKLPTESSAGSFFKNIELDKLPIEIKNVLLERFADKIKGNKLAAGVIIEALGLKGLKNNQAMVSPRHANFLINLGDAKQADILELIHKIQSEAEKKYGIILEPEVNIL